MVDKDVIFPKTWIQFKWTTNIAWLKLGDVAVKKKDVGCQSAGKLYTSEFERWDIFGQFLIAQFSPGKKKSAVQTGAVLITSNSSLKLETFLAQV